MAACWSARFVFAWNRCPPVCWAQYARHKAWRLRWRGVCETRRCAYTAEGRTSVLVETGGQGNLKKNRPQLQTPRQLSPHAGKALSVPSQNPSPYWSHPTPQPAPNKASAVDGSTTLCYTLHEGDKGWFDGNLRASLLPHALRVLFALPYGPLCRGIRMGTNGVMFLTPNGLLQSYWATAHPTTGVT